MIGLEDIIGAPRGRVPRSHRGRRARHVHKGCPGTWETSPSLLRKTTASVQRRPGPGQESGPDGAAFWSEQAVAEEYPTPRNTRLGDGQGGVGALHSTDEGGEPIQGTRWREGGAGTHNRGRERWPAD